MTLSEAALLFGEHFIKNNNGLNEHLLKSWIYFRIRSQGRAVMIFSEQFSLKQVQIHRQ